MAKTTVKIFDIEVRHGGDINHSLIKNGVTEREIRVLRAIHGDDGVVNVKETGEKAIDQREEAFELALRYSKTSNPKHGRKLVESVLSVQLEGFDKWLADREALAEMEREERFQKSQAESARLSRAREAAEAQVRADLARERA